MAVFTQKDYPLVKNFPNYFILLLWSFVLVYTLICYIKYIFYLKFCLKFYTVISKALDDLNGYFFLFLTFCV